MGGHEPALINNLLLLYRLRIINTEGFGSDLLHNLGSFGLIVVIGSDTGDFINILYALNDLSEGGILAV